MDSQTRNILVIVAVVVLALVVGWLVRDGRTLGLGAEEAMPHDMQGMDMGEMMDHNMMNQDGEQGGLGQSRGYRIESNTQTTDYTPNRPAPYIFSAIDEQGNTVKDFATVHEKIMHVIVVRKDLANFQHVHPDFDAATGQFILPSLTFSADGLYRIFADFTPATGQVGLDGQPPTVTAFEDVSVGNIANYEPQLLSETVLNRTFQGYGVQLVSLPTPIVTERPTTLRFVITQNGRLVTDLEKYLGALGHAVVLREGDLEFIHTHALDENVTNQTGRVDFAVTFPTAATYKVFAQFQRQGEVITTDFVVNVASSAAGTNAGNPSLQIQNNSP